VAGLRLRERRAADFLEQFLADRLSEIAKVLGRHDEGVRTADHVVGVVAVEARALVQDGETVDRDAGPHGGIAHRIGVAARIGRAVARDVDHLAGSLERAAGQLLGREGERVRDRGLADQDPACGLDPRGQRRGRCRIRHLGPVDHDEVLMPARPLDHRHRDAVWRRARDRLDHLRIAEGVGDAARLQLELGEVDAARAVDRENQLQVDLDLGSGSLDRSPKQKKGERPTEHDPSSEVPAASSRS
jgi:hypothetical protein